MNDNVLHAVCVREMERLCFIQKRVFRGVAGGWRETGIDFVWTCWQLQSGVVVRVILIGGFISKETLAHASLQSSSAGRLETGASMHNYPTERESCTIRQLRFMSGRLTHTYHFVQHQETSVYDLATLSSYLVQQHKTNTVTYKLAYLHFTVTSQCK